MKNALKLLFLFAALWAVVLRAQTTYVFYDQVCPMPTSVIKPPGEGLLAVGHPGDSDVLSQSFTPFAPGIEFIDLMLSGKGTFYILLRSESPDGSVIASTDPIAISSPPGPPDRTRFYFPSRVSVEADTTYYFQPLISDGNACVSAFYGTQYTAGTAFRGTTPIFHWDVFFREGYTMVFPVIPEPSPLALALAGLFAVVWRIRKISCLSPKRVLRDRHTPLQSPS